MFVNIVDCIIKTTAHSTAGIFNFFGTSAIKSEIILLCNRHIEAKS